jgi:hypothetical protein
MGLSPIDMKGFIPKTQEMSGAENQKDIRVRGQVMAQKTEQEKKFEKEIKQVKDSENAEKARIQKEKEDAQNGGGSSKEDSQNSEANSSKEGLAKLNVSVKEENIAVGRKIDMKA